MGAWRTSRPAGSRGMSGIQGLCISCDERLSQHLFQLQRFQPDTQARKTQGVPPLLQNGCPMRALLFFGLLAASSTIVAQTLSVPPIVERAMDWEKRWFGSYFGERCVGQRARKP